jgi:outer membrane protein OmpA-like peptidoglycan-associated protein
MTTADYEGMDDSPSDFQRWIWPALVVSLALHAALLFWLRQVPVVNSEQEVYEKVVPRTFHLERVEIDPELLKPEPEKRATATAPVAVKLPDDKVSFEKLMGETKGEPTTPKIDQKILSEKPTTASTTLEQTLVTATTTGAQSALEDPKSLQQALLNEKPDAGSSAVTDLMQPDALTGRAIAKAGASAGRDEPGFSNLDDLLAKTGPLTGELAPILMPTDLLFGYNETQLQPTAMASLQKLGTLIQRNPQANFEIEGHSDSFGPDDYNQKLSEQRAESVKAWLVSSMNIPADRITARGFGKTRLIAPASGSIEEQQINRRVEIVIHTK